MKKMDRDKQWSKDVFATNLKYYMNITGKTQKELAEVAEVSEPAFCYWINAEKYPRIDKIQKLADYFNIAKSDLIEEKVTTVMTEKGDIAADITIRLGKDEVFREIVKRNYSDKDFFELSKELCQLNTEQIISLKGTLRSFFK